MLETICIRIPILELSTLRHRTLFHNLADVFRKTDRIFMKVYS